MTMFNVYRRESNDTNPPVTIATSLTAMSYSDSTAEVGKTYLYSVGAVKNGFEEISEEISILAGGDVYIDFVEFIVRQLDPLKDISRDFKDVSPKNTTITKVGDPIVVNPFFGEPCVVMQSYGKFSTTIPALGLSDFCLEIDYASLPGGGGIGGRIMSITNSAGVGSLLIDRIGSTESGLVQVILNDGSFRHFITSSKPVSSKHERIILFRISGVFYLSFSGEIVGLSDSYTTYSITNTTFYYNGWSLGDYYVHGLFGQCRLTVGDSRYTALSTKFDLKPFPENLEDDPLFEKVVFLAKPTHNSLVDRSTYSRSITTHGSPSFTGLQVQNEPILLFYTENSHIRASIPSIETSDLTLEFNNYYFGSSQPYPRIGQFGFSDQISGSCVFSVSKTNITVHFWINGNYSQIISISFDDPLDRPLHFCFMRKNREFYVFINGVLKGQGLGDLFKNFNLNTSLMLGTGANSNTRARVAMHGARFARYARYPTTGFNRPIESFYTQ